MIEALTDCGLSYQEAEAYLTCLRSRSSRLSVKQVAERTGRTPGATRSILGKLQKRGIVSPIEIKQDLYFVARDPKQLIHRLDEQRELLKGIIPQLQQEYRQPEEFPTVQVVHTDARMRQTIQQLLSKNSKLTVVLSGCSPDDEIEDLLMAVNYPHDWLSEHSTVFRYIQNSTSNTKQVTLIGENGVCMLILRDKPYIIWIDSEEHAEHMRVAFSTVSQTVSISKTANS